MSLIFNGDSTKQVSVRKFDLCSTLKMANWNYKFYSEMEISILS